MTEWKCTDGCKAECCGIVPIPKELAKKHEKMAQAKAEEIMAWGENDVVPLTEDAFCIFLDRNTRKCVIYDERPDVCRRYGLAEDLQCQYIDVRGKTRTPAKQRRMLRHINREVGKTIEILQRKEMLQNKMQKEKI
jgi:Fe-S-cluster containining protein